VEQRLGVDYGLARIGLAIGSVVAKEYKTLSNNSHVIDELVKIIRVEGVNKLVVGAPMRSRGEDGTIMASIDGFVEEVKAHVPHLKIDFIDEAYSTSAAHAELKQEGLSIKEAAGRVDQCAAKIILEQYNNEHEISLWGL
jgi:putative Holliday junction resolvase